MTLIEAIQNLPSIARRIFEAAGSNDVIAMAATFQHFEHRYQRNPRLAKILANMLDETSTLTMCVQLQHFKCAILLISKGLAVNKTDKQGGTALGYMMIFDDNDLFHALLHGAADINARCNDGFSILTYAAMFGKRRFVQELLARGVNVEAEDNNRVRALMRAAGHGHTDVVKDLIAHEAIVNAKCDTKPERRTAAGGWGADSFAAFEEHWECVDVISVAMLRQGCHPVELLEVSRNLPGVLREMARRSEPAHVSPAEGSCNSARACSEVVRESIKHYNLDMMVAHALCGCIGSAD